MCTRRYALQPNSVPNAEKNFEYRESAGTKQNLEKSGVGESRLCCIGVSIKFMVLLQKLLVPQQLKKFPCFSGTRMPTAVFTRARQLFLYWARWIHFTPSHAISLRSILIFYTLPRQGLPSGLFPSGLRTKTLYVFLISPLRAMCSARLIFHNFITQIIFSEQ